MTALAPALQAFFTDRLALQRQASSHTIAAYRDALKMLVVITLTFFLVRLMPTNPVEVYVQELVQTYGMSAAEARALIGRRSTRWTSWTATVKPRLGMKGKGCAGSTASGVSTGKTCARK